MAEKIVDKDIEDLKKLIKSKKVIIGSELVLNGLRTGKAAKVFIASNCKKETLSDIEHYSKVTGVELMKLPYPNDELGVLCKKPFAISVLASIR